MASQKTWARYYRLRAWAYRRRVRREAVGQERALIEHLRILADN